MVFHVQARAALADSLEQAGPDAPTLCEGWRAHELAAHVVLRESSWVSLGLAVPALSGVTDRAVDQLVATTGFETLVDRLRQGPPRWHPMAYAGDGAQLVELVVHREDVRRGHLADSGPVDDAVPDDPVITAELERALWRQLVARARLLHLRTRGGLVLVWPGGPRHVVRRPPAGEPSVVLEGRPVELLLQAMGRGAASRVRATGPTHRIATVGPLRGRPAPG